MKKFSQKGVLHFAAMMTLCAFMMPSMASASSWGPVGTEHRLDSNIGFVADALSASSMCANAQFTVNVVSTTVIEITGVSFIGCTVASTNALVGTCTLTASGTSLPWTATAVSTSNIQIHGVNINAFLENEPGSTACSASGQPLKITGTLSNASWLGNTNDPRIELSGSTGLVFHNPALGTSPITSTGTLTDTSTFTPITVTG
jgi:hypothetical protein